MIDWRQRHVDKATKECRAILLEGATREQFMHGDWAPGSMWLWALGVVGPMNSAGVMEEQEHWSNR